MLTHLHADHANGVQRLLSRIDVGTLYLPYGADDEDGLLEGILESAARHGTSVEYVRGGDLDVEFGALRLRLFEPIEAGDENERGVIALASVGEFDALVMGDVNTAVERSLVERCTAAGRGAAGGGPPRLGSIRPSFELLEWPRGRRRR